MTAVAKAKTLFGQRRGHQNPVRACRTTNKPPQVVYSFPPSHARVETEYTIFTSISIFPRVYVFAGRRCQATTCVHSTPGESIRVAPRFVPSDISLIGCNRLSLRESLAACTEYLASRTTKMASSSSSSSLSSSPPDEPAAAEPVDVAPASPRLGQGHAHAHVHHEGRSSVAEGKRRMRMRGSSSYPTLSAKVVPGLSSTPDLGFSYSPTSPLQPSMGDLDGWLFTPPDAAPFGPSTAVAGPSSSVLPSSPTPLEPSTSSAQNKAAATQYGFRLTSPRASTLAPVQITFAHATSPSPSATRPAQDDTAPSTPWQDRVRTAHLNVEGTKHHIPRSVLDTLREACQLTATTDLPAPVHSTTPSTPTQITPGSTNSLTSRLSSVLDRSLKFFGKSPAEPIGPPDSNDTSPMYKIMDLYPPHESFWRCTQCGAPLALAEELVSTSFQGVRSRAYLMNSVVNACNGTHESRLLLTGEHVVADLFCVVCRVSVGWTYVHAAERGQKYKERKHILELRHVRKDLGWV